MTHIRRWTSVLLLAVSFLAGGRTAWAQATFNVSSAATTVIRTGHAEPVGDLTFLVMSGTSRPGIIEIDLNPAVLTSAPAIIAASGFSPTAFSVTVDPEAGRVALHVPSGMGPGTSVSVEGLRVSVHESGIRNTRRADLHGRKPADRREPGHSGHRRGPPTPLSSILRPIRSTATARAAYSSTLSATSPSARGSRGRSLTTQTRDGPHRPRSSSRRRRCPETPSSGFRSGSDRKPAPR